jgi:hypothetical protein
MGKLKYETYHHREQCSVNNRVKELAVQYDSFGCLLPLKVRKGMANRENEDLSISMLVGPSKFQKIVGMHVQEPMSLTVC